MLREPRAAPVVGLRLELVLVQRDDVGIGQEDAVLFDVHRMQPRTDEVVVLERHGTTFFDHHSRVAPEGRDPVAELLGVGDRGRQGHHTDGRRQVDQHLLPDGAAVRVLEVVDLVHHDREQTRERRRPFVEHVPEHFGGHDDDRRFGVDRVVSREQPDRACAVLGHEIAELLVGQGLQRRRVEGLAAAIERPLDRELGDDGLAGAGRRRDQHRRSSIHRVDRITLEPVQLEGELLREIGWGGHGGASLRAALRATDSVKDDSTNRCVSTHRRAPCRMPREPRGSRGARRPRSAGVPRRARARRCRR